MPKSSIEMRTPMSFRLLQRAVRGLGVLHQQALGHLELDQARVQAVALQRRGHALLEVRLLELPGGDVHRHRHQRQALAFPAA